MNVDSYTKLKLSNGRYDGTLYSPIKRPPKVGELALTLSHPRGYAVVVLAIHDQVANVAFLDDLPGSARQVDLMSLIPTGKTPLDLCAMYEPTPLSLDEALDRERSLPEFAPKKTKAKGGERKKKEPKNVADNLTMTKEEKDQIKKMLVKLLKGGDK